MTSALTWFVIVTVLLLPPASIAGLILWARRLSKRPETPRYAARIAYGLAGIGGLAVAAGLLGLVPIASSLTGEAVDPSEKARHLGEGIAEVMNCEALGLLVAGVAAAWILFWRTRPKRPS
jgi:hypothetical protein